MLIVAALRRCGRVCVVMLAGRYPYLVTAATSYLSLRGHDRHRLWSDLAVESEQV